MRTEQKRAGKVAVGANGLVRNFNIFEALYISLLDTSLWENNIAINEFWKYKKRR